MTTLTSTAADLYAAILLQPEDDTLRLVYADALEESAGKVDCNICRRDGKECPHQVSNGCAELAEFIRVQMELATKWPDRDKLRCSECSGHHPTHLCTLWCESAFTRESQLLAQHGDGWRRGEVCERCKDDRGWEMKHHGKVQWTGCSKCRGTGYTSPLSGRRLGAQQWRYDPQFRRGLIAQYSATHAEVCDRDGPSEWACEVARFAPIERVVITDAEPWEDDIADPATYRWHWDRDRDHDPDWRLGGLPRWLIEAMPRDPDHADSDKRIQKIVGGIMKTYSSEAAATDALALAVAQRVRHAAFKEKR